jgi:transposase
LSIGIDVAKDTHWVTAMTDLGEIVFDQAAPNTPADLATLLEALRALGGTRTIGLDMLGNIAVFVVATLLDAGETLVYVPGRSVHRARAGFRGGEHKSDPKDARVIADQVRARRAELRAITHDDLDAATTALKLLITRRRVLTTEQTRRLTQLHDILVQVHPGLERRLVLRQRRGGLYLLTRYVTPREIRDAGFETLLQFLKASPYRLTQTRRLAQHALEAALEQRLALPAEDTAARLVRELATEALMAMDKLAALDNDLAAEIARHPEGALMQTLPGMGVVCTAEILAHTGRLCHRFPNADHLAAAAGLAPILRQTGRSRFVKQPLGGDKRLKRACYLSALAAVKSHPASRAYYDRKRREGKRHVQALIALARRRITVLYIMVKTGTPYQEPVTTDPHPCRAIAA